MAIVRFFKEKYNTKLLMTEVAWQRCPRVIPEFGEEELPLNTNESIEQPKENLSSALHLKRL